MVLVIGNTSIDECWRMSRLPVPGETVLAAGVTRDLGGKGANQAIVLARAGTATRFVTAVGNDADARWAIEQLARHGFCATIVDAATDRSLIMTDLHGENFIVSTVQAVETMGAGLFAPAIESSVKGEWLLMQGNLTVAETRAAFFAARARGMRIAFNAAPVRAGFELLWPLVDLAVLNQTEAFACTAVSEPAAAAALMQRNGVGRVAITLGADGALLAGPNGLIRQPAFPADIIDTSGAGDTVAAMLVAAVSCGKGDAEALRLACAAAALTVSRPGTGAALPTVAELQILMSGG